MPPTVTDSIKLYSSCHGCDQPTGIGQVSWIFISVSDGNVVLDDSEAHVSHANTVAWHTTETIKTKWTVQFDNQLLEPETFFDAHCGFTVLNLPTGNYGYTAQVEGVAQSAKGVLSVS